MSDVRVGVVPAVPILRFPCKYLEEIFAGKTFKSFEFNFKV